MQQAGVVNQAVYFRVLNHNVELLTCTFETRSQASKGICETQTSFTTSSLTCEDLPCPAGEHDPGTLKDCLLGPVTLADPETFYGKLRLVF